MKRRAAIAILATAATLAALSSSAATASTHRPHRHLSGVPQIWLPASDGYRIGVSERRGAVVLTVMRKHGRHGGTATTYVARGTAGPQLLRASFGRFGQISMRFHPAGSKARLAPHGRCHGPGTPLVRPGVFVGHLRFRGEDGYVALDVHRARGRISRPALRCLRRFHPNRRQRPPRRSLLRPAKGGAGHKEITYLAAQSKDATSSEMFVALKLKGQTAFVAMTSGNVGKVSRFHLALALGRRPAFALNGALTGGRVTPGRPFTGSAAYGAAPDGTRTWEGPLAVNFPGSPHFPLTGAPLETSVGTLPALFVLFLLKSAKAGDALSLAATEKPSPLIALGVAPR